MAAALSTASVARTFGARTVSRAARRSTVAVKAAGAAWFPGKEAPAHLAAKPSLPGNFGFDPLGLAKEDEFLSWYVQAELQNGRWAMLGVAGILTTDIFHAVGLGGPAAQVAWYDAGAYDGFWIPNNTLVAIEIFLFAWVELRRLQDMRNPGSVNSDPFNPNLSLPKGEVGYPGGIFDFLGYSKGDLATLKQKEIKNGRLAMLAFLGFVAQHNSVGGRPLENLSAHLADPWSSTFLTNGISLPFTGTGTELGLNILGGAN